MVKNNDESTHMDIDTGYDWPTLFKVAFRADCMNATQQLSLLNWPV